MIKSRACQSKSRWLESGYTAFGCIRGHRQDTWSLIFISLRQGGGDKYYRQHVNKISSHHSFIQRLESWSFKLGVQKSKPVCFYVTRYPEILRDDYPDVTRLLFYLMK